MKKEFFCEFLHILKTTVFNKEAAMAQKKFVYFVLYGAFAVLLFYLGFRYALPAVLPFLVAFFIAASVQGISERFSARTGAKKRYVSLFFGMLFFAASGFFLFLCISKLWGELSALVGGALDAREDIMGRTQALLRKVESFVLRLFPAAEGNAEVFRARIELFAEEALKSIISAVSTHIPAFMARVFSEVPKILFSLAVTLISCVYLCLDYDYIRAAAKKITQRGGLPMLAKIPRASFLTIAKYLRALFVIFLMTAAVLAVGFLIIGIKYAWLLAVFAAFIDALPLFGSGAVLLPYAAFMFIAGDFRRGIGLLLLWGAVLLLRQFAEPKIMGKNLGLHPLLNIAAVYIGYSFFGVTGVIFLPITIVILKNLFIPEERSLS